MQGRQKKKIKTENLEGLILCLTIELGLYSVNYWESQPILSRAWKGQMRSLGEHAAISGE